MTLSAVGSLRLKVYGVLLLVNTIVLILSAHINHFQEFFYKADVFPLALSVVTMAFTLTMIFLDINFKNAVTARPPFELGWLFVFSALWLACNAFSTNRWRYVGLGMCKTIPSDAQYVPYRTWCHELQALRVFVWIEWVMFLLTFVYLLRWTISIHNNGRRDVWSTAFSRFAEMPSDQRRYRADSEFLQWEKFPQEQLPASPRLQYASSEQPPSNYSQPHPFDRYMETQNGPLGEPQYTQSLGNQRNGPSEEAHYAQSLEDLRVVETLYPQYHPQAQYMPPSQAQFAHSAQVLSGEPMHTL